MKSLAFPEQQIPGDNQTHLLNPFVSPLAVSYMQQGIILYHTTFPANSQFQFVNSLQQMPRQRQRGHCEFLSEVLMLFLDKNRGRAARPSQHLRSHC
jgi:hypothetical protein